jgi:aerotaxis receptor
MDNREAPLIWLQSGCVESTNKLSQIEVINEPRPFEVEELFFSTTDLKGRIQRANSVFTRIAAYSWAQLHNKPHNIIRHPDMPRVVFQLLWDYIQAGRPIVAYVKNLAHDGRYYWVFALVTPMEGGYLSVRFKPTSPLRHTVEQLYKDLRAVEASIEDQSHDRKAAIAASRTALDAALQKPGFCDYDAFMRHAMKTEIQSREAKLRRVQSADVSLVGLDSLSAQAALFDRMVVVLETLFCDLAEYVEISQGVKDKSASVADISESLRVSALNGAIEADKLGAKAAGLRPVLDWLRGLSADITTQGASFSGALNELVSEVDHVVFDLMAARLQVEMTATFAHEIADHATRAQGGEAISRDAVLCLHAVSCQTIRRALQRLLAMRDRLHVLSESQMSLIQASRSLRPIYLTGRIEMAEGVGARLASVFEDVGGQLSETADSLKGLGKLLVDLSDHLTRGLGHGDEIEAAIAQIDSRVHAAC